MASTLMACAAFMLAAVATPTAEARAGRLGLSLPRSVPAGARVMATGRLGGHERHGRVLLQRRAGRHWRTLARGRARGGRYRASFLAPVRPGAILVRAVLYRNGHRRSTSRVHRLLVLRRAAAAPRTPPAPGGPAIAAWGANAFGELGAGYYGSASTLPVPLRGVGAVKAIVAGYTTSYALLADGTVQAWGESTFGQLGNGTRQMNVIPGPVIGLTGVTAIAASGDHAMALLRNGTVATWGGNSYGQMGNGTTLAGKEGTGSTVPQIVPGLSGVVAIAAGGADDAALLANGTVLAWGENRHGQLGDGTTVEKDRPTPVQGLSGVRQVAFGGTGSLGGHMLALLDDGTVRAIGANGSGQLGDGTTTDSSSPVAVRGLGGAVAVSASVSHSMALLKNGTVVSWGNNAYGELGVGSGGPEHCEGAVQGAPSEPCSRVPVPVGGLTNVSAISAGFRFSVALSAGHVLAWGANDVGQLGLGNTTGSSRPVAVQGVGEADQIAAGEKYSFAVLKGTAPPPVVELIPGAGSLTIRWRARENSEQWFVAWRPDVRPPVEWTAHVSLPAPTRSYTITGLGTRPYEVRLRNAAFGIETGVGTPLP